MNTPRMQEAWDKSSRTADGFYSSQTPTSEYATSCYDEGCKLERELADAIRQRDEARATCSELVTDSNAITLARTVVRITQELAEARGERDRLAEALLKLRNNESMSLGSAAYEIIEQALQSLTPNASAMASADEKTPPKADCPSAPCSPSDYDAGLLNDFGGGDIGWWQDYLRAEVGRANEYWREIHDQQNALMVMPPNP